MYGHEFDPTSDEISIDFLKPKIILELFNLGLDMLCYRHSTSASLGGSLESLMSQDLPSTTKLLNGLLGVG
jgi:hypothetical protein